MLFCGLLGAFIEEEVEVVCSKERAVVLKSALWTAAQRYGSGDFSFGVLKQVQIILNPLIINTQKDMPQNSGRC